MTAPDPETAPGAALDILRASPLFDASWYQLQHPDVADSGLDPAAHYLLIGAAIGRDPGPGFTTRGYLAAYPEAADSDLNPLVHFETAGRALGYSPDPARPPVLAHRRDQRRAVDVVVPVFNAPDHVRACLQSLAEAPTACAVRVLVVDDASDPETADWLRAACPGLGNDRVRFEYLRHPENRGYTAAANTGLRMGRAPHAVLLNSDTVVTPWWLDGLLRCMDGDPAIGIAGPLSNAASWQNVPDLHAPGGGFAINALPDGMTPADMAALVRRVSRVRHPEIGVVNGFCYMIRRAVLDRIGYLDEDTFPVAYGEENDLCLRAAAAGFRLHCADDTYVYHAKSQSFGTARRKALSEDGLRALKAKHGEDRVAALLARVANAPDMAAMRRRVARALADRARMPDSGAAGWLLRQRILFLLPVGAGGGGAHSVVQEAMAMRALGVTVQIAVGSFAWQEFREAYADIPGFETLFIPFQPEAPTLIAGRFDVVVATLYSTVSILEEIVAAYPDILPAYYSQDYEPLFFPAGSPEWQEAHGSYTRLPQMQVFAKTAWICDQIEAAHGIPVAKVSPSLDHDVYYPEPRGDAGPLRVTAMIRPGTPRRGADRTMELLAHLHALHGTRLNIALFGCDPDGDAFLKLRRDFPFEMAGPLTRAGVASLLRRTDIFLDLSDYQAFGRTALEAMACGALALVPAEGGSDEYAVDGVNALVADTMDVGACLKRLGAVLDDPAALQRMRLAALATAAEYSPRRAALSELTVLATALARHRAAPEAAPETVPVPEETMPADGTAAPVLIPAPAFAQGPGAVAGPALTLPGGPIAALPDPVPDIAVHLHLHYPDMAPEFAARLQQIPVPFRLYVSVPEGQERPVRRTLSRALKQADTDVRSWPNRGRDIGPFVAGFGTDLARHDLVCHIHSKRSPQNAAKHDWRAQLLGALLDSPAAVAEILTLFAQNPHLGLVFPDYHPALADQIGWGTNFDAATAMAARIGMAAPDPGRLRLFPAGSMFWARAAALAPLLTAGLTFDDFPAESGQVDNTPAHAIERLLGGIVAEAGFGQVQVRAAATAAKGDDDAGT